MERNNWVHYLQPTNKYVLLGYFCLPNVLSENRFIYLNETSTPEQVIILLFSTSGIVVDGFPIITTLEPGASYECNVGEHSTTRGDAVFQGSVMLIVTSLKKLSTSPSIGDKDLMLFWLCPNHSHNVSTAGFSTLNITGKKEKQSYYMFCPMIVHTPKVTTRLVILNHSTDPEYNDTITLAPILHNLKGEKVFGSEILLPPFGTAIIDVSTFFGEAGKRLLAITDGRGSITTIHRGHVLASFFFYIDRLSGDMISGRHTQPSIGVCFGLEKFHYIFNSVASRIPYLQYAMTIRSFLKQIPKIFRTIYPGRPLFIGSLWQYIRQARWTIYLLVMVRASYFMIRKGFRFDIFEITQQSNKNIHVIEHNLWEDLLVFNFNRVRIERLLWPLKCTPGLKLDGQTLCIGPRSEGELLLLAGHGFKFKNITGIDLFSYSPKILVMDVHQMSFPDNFFDTIFAGWMFKYCYDLKKAVNEIIRVAKDGAIITCGFTRVNEEDDVDNYVNVHLSGGITELLTYFGAAVGQVYWRNEDLIDGYGKMTVVFRVKKSMSAQSVYNN